MCSQNEVLDDLQDQLIPKSEPIDVDFIKTEEFEGKSFVIAGLFESFKVDEVSVKEEILENEEKFSKSNVRSNFLILFFEFLLLHVLMF